MFSPDSSVVHVQPPSSAETPSTPAGHLRLQDAQGLDLVRALMSGKAIVISVALVESANTGHFVASLQVEESRAAGVVLSPDTVPASSEQPVLEIVSTARGGLEAHAAARWAKAVVPLIDSPRDPRTIGIWARWIAASPGAVRSWCQSAGINPRRALVFGRLLRGVVLSEGGRYKPENVFDVVDPRTLTGILKMAGLSPSQALPETIESFLSQQVLIRDPDILREVARTIEQRSRDRQPRREVHVAPRSQRSFATAYPRPLPSGR
jgi:hypothetical protein